LTGYAAIESLGKVTQPLVSDIGYDSEVAIEMNGDLRLVNQTLAHQFFDNQDPMSQKIKFQVFDRAFLDAPHNNYFDIIGVVPDFQRRPGGTRYSVVPEAFVPSSVAGFGNPLSIGRELR